ncbi:terpene cyclase [Streptomyces sp. NPDC051310]|uniref:terpene synthase family protein n=1 Tax=Streptomyces sp. NPDC051310 TaxID=3365649 RepID=UPI0037BB4138
MTGERTDTTARTHIPELHCPLPHRVNPYAEQARRHLSHWVGTVGLIQRESARRRFEHADFGWFASVVYPTADEEGIALMADWFAWLFLVDDQLDDGAFGRDPEHAGQVVAGMRAVLESADHGEAAARRTGLPTAVSSLADLWRRTAPGMPAAWRHRFVRHLEDCLTAAAVWEAGNRVRGIVPEEDDYIENRRHTGAIYVCMDLIDVVERLDVPVELYDSEAFREALDAACNVVCWTNDIYSLEKERSLGEVHNLVHVVEHHRGLDARQAMDHVCEATSAETRRYLKLEERLLHRYPEHSGVLLPYVSGMRTWIRGNLDWSSRTKRYQAQAGAPVPQPASYLEPDLVVADR